jgi:hypothetical protein
MRQISSGTTFYNKRVSPVSFLGMSAVILIVALYQALTRGGEAIFFVIVVMLALACGSYFAKKNFFDLVDEVRDAGDALIVRNGGREERIALSDITNVSYSLFFQPSARDAYNSRGGRSEQTTKRNKLLFAVHV